MVGAVGLRLRRVHGAVALDVRTAQPVFSHAFGVSLVPVRVAAQFHKLGSPVPYAGLVLALLAVAAWKRDWLSAATAATGPALAVFTAEHLKPQFGRTEGGVDAYPSGHTTALTALAVIVILVAWRRRGWGSLALTGPLAVVLAGGMVLTVVRLHAHLMSDAIGGVFLGAGIVTGIAGVFALAPLGATRTGSHLTQKTSLNDVRSSVLGVLEPGEAVDTSPVDCGGRPTSRGLRL